MISYYIILYRQSYQSYIINPNISQSLLYISPSFAPSLSPSPRIAGAQGGIHGFQATTDTSSPHHLAIQLGVSVGRKNTETLLIDDPIHEYISSYVNIQYHLFISSFSYPASNMLISFSYLPAASAAVIAFDVLGSPAAGAPPHRAAVLHDRHSRPLRRWPTDSAGQQRLVRNWKWATGSRAYHI